jgi:hypothetical protein
MLICLGLTVCTLIDINHVRNYITLLLAHSCAFALDHTRPEFEEPTQQAQAEDLTYLALDQGKP